MTLTAQGAWALYTNLLPGGKRTELRHASEVYPSPNVSKGREAWSDGLEDPRKGKEAMGRAKDTIQALINTAVAN